MADIDQINGISKDARTAAPPPVAPSAPAARAKPEKIEPQRLQNDAARPVRRGFTFIGGTLKGALDGIASGGRKGLYWGAVAGIALAYLPMFLGAGASIGLIAMGYEAFSSGLLLTNVMAGALGGFLGGAALLGTKGVLTGGVKSVQREQRREKYADDLAIKEEERQIRHGHRPNYRDLYNHHRKADSYNMDRLQYLETSRDWQERIEAERNSGSQGRGL